MPETIPPATLDYRGAAAYIGVSLSTLKRLVASGTVRHVPVRSRRVLFRRTDLDDYLDRAARGGIKPRRGAS